MNKSFVVRLDGVWTFIPENDNLISKAECINVGLNCKEVGE